MKIDKRKPSKVTDRFWLVSIFEHYRFKKEASERKSGKWLIFEDESEIDEPSMIKKIIKHTRE